MAVAQQAANEEADGQISGQTGGMMMLATIHGWKRKAGCVTLLLACAFAGGWLRSRRYWDGCEIIGRQVVINAVSTQDCLHFSKRGILLEWPKRYTLPRVKVTVIDSHKSQRHVPGEEKLPRYSAPTSETVWRFNFLDFYVSRSDESSIDTVSVTIPYWSIVLPLTAISAWLLLSKPRAKIEPPIAEDREP